MDLLKPHDLHIKELSFPGLDLSGLRAPAFQELGEEHTFSVSCGPCGETEGSGGLSLAVTGIDMNHTPHGVSI
jgi:hypothetical protein